MIALAADPGHLQALRREGQERALEQTRQAGVAVAGLHEVFTRWRPGLPEAGVGPGRALHALVPGAARTGPGNATADDGPEGGKLVRLRIVDRIARHHHQLQGCATQRAALDPVQRSDHGIQRVGVEGLLGAVHRKQEAEARIGALSVHELEAGRRLDVGQVEVGQVGEARDRPPRAPRAGPGRGVDQVAADRVGFAGKFGEGVVRGLAAGSEDRPPAQPARRGQRRRAHPPPAAASSRAISTGSARRASRTRVPAGRADASEVGS